MAATVYSPVSAAVLASGAVGVASGVVGVASGVVGMASQGICSPRSLPPADAGRGRDRPRMEVYSPLAGAALGPALGLALDPDALLGKGRATPRGQDSPSYPAPDPGLAQPGKDSPYAAPLPQGRESPYYLPPQRPGSPRGSPYSHRRQGSRGSPASLPRPASGGESPGPRPPNPVDSPPSHPRSRESLFASRVHPGLEGLHAHSLDSPFIPASRDWPFSPLAVSRSQSQTHSRDSLLPSEPGGVAAARLSDTSLDLNRRNGNSPHRRYREIPFGSRDSNQNPLLTDL